MKEEEMQEMANNLANFYNFKVDDREGVIFSNLPSPSLEIDKLDEKVLDFIKLLWSDEELSNRFFNQAEKIIDENNKSKIIGDKHQFYISPAKIEKRRKFNSLSKEEKIDLIVKSAINNDKKNEEQLREANREVIKDEETGGLIVGLL